MKSKSQEEIAEYYFKRIREHFEANISTHYIDINDPEIEEYPEIKQWLSERKIEVPVVAVNNAVVLSGRFASGHVLQKIRDAMMGKI